MYPSIYVALCSAVAPVTLPKGKGESVCLAQREVIYRESRHGLPRRFQSVSVKGGIPPCICSSGNLGADSAAVRCVSPPRPPPHPLFFYKNLRFMRGRRSDLLKLGPPMGRLVRPSFPSSGPKENGPPLAPPGRLPGPARAFTGSDSIF